MQGKLDSALGKGAISQLFLHQNSNVALATPQIYLRRVSTCWCLNVTPDQINQHLTLTGSILTLEQSPESPGGLNCQKCRVISSLWEVPQDKNSALPKGKGEHRLGTNSQVMPRVPTLRTIFPKEGKFKGESGGTMTGGGRPGQMLVDEEHLLGMIIQYRKRRWARFAYLMDARTLEERRRKSA